MAMGPDDATAITNELYRYAELVDAGRFDLRSDPEPEADDPPASKEHQP